MTAASLTTGLGRQVPREEAPVVLDVLPNAPGTNDRL